MLGKALRRLREAAEISRDTAGKAILDYYRHWMNLLTTQAEEPDATPEILRRLLAET